MVDMDQPLDERLRSQGVKVTAQRLAILRAVSARPHTTADDLAEVVRAAIGAISRQAVYDSLGVLADKSLSGGSSRPGRRLATRTGSATTTTT